MEAPGKCKSRAKAEKKKAGVRTKFLIESLRNDDFSLREENERLRGLVSANLDEGTARQILSQCYDQNGPKANVGSVDALVYLRRAVVWWCSVAPGRLLCAVLMCRAQLCHRVDKVKVSRLRLVSMIDRCCALQEANTQADTRAAEVAATKAQQEAAIQHSKEQEAAQQVRLSHQQCSLRAPAPVCIS